MSSNLTVSELKKHPETILKYTPLAPYTMGGVSDILDVLDSVSAKGTKIYISSPNEGPYKFNILSLVDNAICVGSMDKHGVKYYSAENSLIKRYHYDDLVIKKTKNGYSLDGGNTTTFKDSQVSKFSDKPYSKIQSGASFATPRVYGF